MYKSKYPSLIDFLTNEEELILLDSEIQNIESLIDKDLKAINYSRCCKSDSELLVCDNCDGDGGRNFTEGFLPCPKCKGSGFAN